MSEPVRLAPSRAFDLNFKEVLRLGKETVEMVFTDGDALNTLTGDRFTEIRDRLERSDDYLGVHRAQDGLPARVDEIPNPDAPDGRWDPAAWMPHFAFDPAEDAFPVAPDFDGDTNMGNNAPSSMDAKERGAYQDGVIGGKQGLASTFTVSRTAGYTVLTYQFYYPHNKAGHYHAGDYSTAQVYLKPGPKGKLEPAYLATSWHYGSVLTPWDKLAKDREGRPVISVQLGSHALQPRMEGEAQPPAGLRIQSGGQATKDGKPLAGQTMAFTAFQQSVKNATVRDVADPASKAHLGQLGWGAAALEPFEPKTYTKAPGPIRNLLDRSHDWLRDEWRVLKDRLKDRLPFI